MAKALIKEVYAKGGIPFLNLESGELLREWLEEATPEQIDLEASFQKARMGKMDCYLGLRNKDNIYEMAGLNEEKIKLYNTLLLHPVHHGIRVAKTKWVVLRSPNHAMAQEAKMNTDEFKEFYYKVCNLDYAKMLKL